MCERMLRSVLMLLCCVASLDATAAEWPTRPIRMIVHTAAGQSSDIIARLVADYISRELGQPVFVENRPGASGLVAMETAKAAPADGYTLVMGSTSTLAVNPNIFERMPYSPGDFVPIVHLTTHPLFLVSSTKSGIRDFSSFVMQAKARPGSLNYGSSGNGTTQQVAMEVLKAARGLDLTHVPYKSAPQMNQDLMAGNIDVAFEVSSLILPQRRSNRLNFLAVSSKERSSLLPELPSLLELGVEDFDIFAWTMLLVRKGTPANIVERLDALLKKALKSEEFVSTLRNNASEPGKTSSADLPRMIQRELAFWGRTLRHVGVYPK